MLRPAILLPCLPSGLYRRLCGISLSRLTTVALCRRQLARTRRVSAFPVGLVTQTGLSTPVVRNGAVVGFYDGWIGGRTFPMDMAGFAVSVQLLLQVRHARQQSGASPAEEGGRAGAAPVPSDREGRAREATRGAKFRYRITGMPVNFHYRR